MAKPTLLQVARSAFAALVGVQSNENRQRDFEHGSAGTFIVTGIIGTLALVLVLILLVSIVVG